MSKVKVNGNGNVDIVIVIGSHFCNISLLHSLAAEMTVTWRRLAGKHRTWCSTTTAVDMWNTS